MRKHEPEILSEDELVRLSNNRNNKRQRRAALRALQDVNFIKNMGAQFSILRDRELRTINVLTS